MGGKSPFSGKTILWARKYGPYFSNAQSEMKRVWVFIAAANDLEAKFSAGAAPIVIPFILWSLRYDCCKNHRHGSHAATKVSGGWSLQHG